jgi:hypothetical protein
MSVNWDKFPNVMWYGERGVVNTIVKFIGTQPDQVVLVQSLLSAVKWADKGRKDWIQDICDARFIVELGLAGFGDPDLILLVKNTDGSVRCILIEAKAITYIASAKPNKSGLGTKGFNSTINGQLSLKYRFAVALKNREEREGIVETEFMWQNYTQYADGKQLNRGKLNQPTILSEIIRPLGLRQIQSDHFYFVALTWDRPDRAFVDDPSIEPDLLPLLLDQNGKDIFSEMRPKIGWIGYAELEKALGIEGDKEYCFARDVMMGSNMPEEIHYLSESLRALDQFDNEVQELADEMAQMFGANGVYPEKIKGSYSVKDGDGTTIAKILPKNNGVFVGIRVDEKTAKPYLNPQMWSEQSLEAVGIGPVKFKGLLIKTGQKEGTRHYGIASLIDGFASRLKSHTT